tara:strand:- start:334 stop:1098 length:765 start_codon:yes stop_codon:yes gene_type:complete
MKSIYTLTKESFLILRRGKLFLSSLVASMLVIIFANIASSWGVEEFYRILFDIGLLGFDMIGGMTAIIWGTYLIAEAQKDGSVEAQLASPISRNQWVIAKFLSLTLALSLLSCLLVIFWQLLMLLNNFGWLSKLSYLFVVHTLGWFVLGSCALFFSTFCEGTTALFCSLCLWGMGLLSRVVFDSLPQDVDVISANIIGFIYKIWDLQFFNISFTASTSANYSLEQFLWTITYGLSILLTLLCASCVTFARKDIN